MDQTISDQKESLELDAKFVWALINEDLEDDELNAFEVVLNDYAGTWRWGVTNELVLKDIAGNYWRTYWQEQTGDNYWNTFEDGGEIDFERVEPVEKVVIRYVRATD